MYTQIHCVRGFWPSDRETPAAKSLYRPIFLGDDILHCLLWVLFFYGAARDSLAWGGTIHMQNAYMCEILLDWKFLLSQVTELRDGRLFMFEDEAAKKNFCTKRGSLGQFLIRIWNPGFGSGSKSGIRFRIWIRIWIRIRIQIRIQN